MKKWKTTVESEWRNDIIEMFSQLHSLCCSLEMYNTRLEFHTLSVSHAFKILGSPLAIPEENAYSNRRMYFNSRLTGVDFMFLHQASDTMSYCVKNICTYFHVAEGQSTGTKMSIILVEIISCIYCINNWRHWYFCLGPVLFIFYQYTTTEKPLSHTQGRTKMKSGRTEEVVCGGWVWDMVAYSRASDSKFHKLLLHSEWNQLIWIFCDQFWPQMVEGGGTLVVL